MTDEQVAKRTTEMSKKLVSSILEANKKKDFVQRILEPNKYPVKKNEDGTISTHLMAYGEVDGKTIAYPTLFYDKENKSLYRPDKPILEALKTKNFITFKNAQEAEWFTQNYKLAMPSQ
jgi:hypothetical protein